jgi:pimeloyl-ACP methyl ester carboxylesterase
MHDGDLAVYIAAFAKSGFTGGINWYRNLDRDWHLLADVDPIIHQPALMIYGDRDAVAQAENLAEFVPDVDEIHLDSGHWIQQERPEETNRTILEWLARHDEWDTTGQTPAEDRVEVEVRAVKAAQTSTSTRS